MKNLNFAMIMTAAALSLNFLSLKANAATDKSVGCSFIARASTPALFSAEPTTVIGAATCDQAYPNTNSLMVLNLKTLDEKSLSLAVLEVAKIEHPMNESAEVTWKSNQPLSQRQMMVTTLVQKTDHSNAQTMLHYASVAKMTDGSFLVFVHSASEQQSHAARLSLESLNRDLRKPSVLTQISNQLMPQIRG